MNTPHRVRYAPSPTGELHLGSLRTVIFDYLVARQTGGTFIMREEDTDQARSVEGSMQRQLEGLQWMGIVPDEGVCLDSQGNLTEKGSYGPYTQSKRLHIYKEHVTSLIEKGSAYRCFCTSERLDEMRKAQQAEGHIPKYDRLCRNLPKEESEARANAGEPHVIRQAMPLDGEVSVADVVRGELTFKCVELDDHVLLKTDGFPTYQLANVVDDHLMEISLVIRGEEWIPSTPKNLLLYRAFGWEAPLYAHVPVILGPDGKHKLSKRDGASTVLEYRDKGYLPQALLNVLAFLGWSPGTEEEFLTIDQLIEKFRLEKVQKSPAVFNFDRVDYVNGWYIRHLSLKDVVAQMLPWWEKAGLIKRRGSEIAITGDLEIGHTATEYIDDVALAIQERIKHFDETVLLTRFFFEAPEFSPELLDLIVPKKRTLSETAVVLEKTALFLEKWQGEWNQDELSEALFAFITENNWKNGDVLWPVRAVLTGEPASPGAFEMLSVLGREESLRRLNGVLELLPEEQREQPADGGGDEPDQEEN